MMLQRNVYNQKNNFRIDRIIYPDISINLNGNKLRQRKKDQNHIESTNSIRKKFNNFSKYVNKIKEDTHNIIWLI